LKCTITTVFCGKTLSYLPQQAFKKKGELILKNAETIHIHLHPPNREGNTFLENKFTSKGQQQRNIENSLLMKKASCQIGYSRLKWENKILTPTCNTLLPKLMSRKIRLDNPNG
jgi:hypothetical protein